MDFTAYAEIGCAVLALIGSLFAYLWRRSESARDDTIEGHGEAIDALKDALAAYKLHVAETYVTANNFEKALQGLTETFKAVFAKLDRIEDKLDGKADKP